MSDITSKMAKALLESYECYEVVGYEDEIVKIRNPYLSYCIIKYGQSRMKYGKKHIEIILESRNPECIYGLLDNIPSKVNIQKCLDIIAESGNAEYNYKSVEKFGYKIANEECTFDYSKNVEAILNSGDAKYNYMLANLIQKHIVYVAGLTEIEKQYYSILESDEKDILNRCRSKVLESGDAEYNYLFAKDIRTDIDLHTKVVLESKSGKYNYLFGRNIFESDKKKHYDVVLESGDLEYIYAVAFELSNLSESERVENIIKDIDLDINVEDYLNYIIESGDAKYNYLAAFNVKNSDRKRHLNAVIKSFDPKYNYLSAIAIDLINKVGCEISVSSDLKYNSLSRKSVLNNLKKEKNEEIYELDDKLLHGISVMMSGDLEYNYLFARDVVNADVKSHEKVILAAWDADYSRKFIKIPGSNYEAHYQIILDNESDKVDKIMGMKAPKSKILGRKIDLIKEQTKKGSKI